MSIPDEIKIGEIAADQNHQHFNDMVPLKDHGFPHKIKNIIVQYNNEHVWGIRVVYQVGNGSEVKGQGSIKFRPLRTLFTSLQKGVFEIANDDYIKEISGYYGDKVINQIVFETYKGHNASFGVKKGVFFRHSYPQHTFAAARGSYERFVDFMAFKVVKLPDSHVQQYSGNQGIINQGYQQSSQQSSNQQSDYAKPPQQYNNPQGYQQQNNNPQGDQYQNSYQQQSYQNPQQQPQQNLQQQSNQQLYQQNQQQNQYNPPQQQQQGYQQQNQTQYQYQGPNQNQVQMQQSGYQQPNYQQQQQKQTQVIIVEQQHQQQQQNHHSGGLGLGLVGGLLAGVGLSSALHHNHHNHHNHHHHGHGHGHRHGHH